MAGMWLKVMIKVWNSNLGMFKPTDTLCNDICVYLYLDNYSCVFGKRNYRVLVRVSLCVCVCVCVSVFVCVFLHDNSKRNQSRNTKLEYIVVYENSSDEFDIELHRIKVKITVGVQKFSPFTTIQTVRSYSSNLAQARNLILSICLHLILIYKINECRHA